MVPRSQGTRKFHHVPGQNRALALAWRHSRAPERAASAPADFPRGPPTSDWDLRDGPLVLGEPCRIGPPRSFWPRPLFWV